MNFFEQGGNAMNPEGTFSGNDVHYCPEDRKITWMREKRIKLFMLMELENYRNELGWLIRCHNCTVDKCPEKHYPPRSLPIPPGYTEDLERRIRKAMKGMLSPTRYIKNDSQDVLFTTSTSSARSSKASGNFIMLAITNASH